MAQRILWWFIMNNIIISLLAGILMSFVILVVIGRANREGYREGYQRAEGICEQQLQRCGGCIQRRENEAGAATG